MKQFLVQFRAEYYCQGYEWSTFQRLVKANSFDAACTIIKELDTPDWEKGTPTDFKNLNI